MQSPASLRIETVEQEGEAGKRGKTSQPVSSDDAENGWCLILVVLLVFLGVIVPSAVLVTPDSSPAPHAWHSMGTPGFPLHPGCLLPCCCVRAPLPITDCLSWMRSLTKRWHVIKVVQSRWGGWTDDGAFRSGILLF